jgi:hypothetical protein
MTSAAETIMTQYTTPPPLAPFHPWLYHPPQPITMVQPPPPLPNPSLGLLWIHTWAMSAPMIATFEAALAAAVTPTSRRTAPPTRPSQLTVYLPKTN